MSDEGDIDMGFEAYTKSSLIAGKRMLRQLSLLAQLIFDAHALEDEYGLKPTSWPERVRSTPNDKIICLTLLGIQRSFAI